MKYWFLKIDLNCKVSFVVATAQTKQTFPILDAAHIFSSLHSILSSSSGRKMIRFFNLAILAKLSFFSTRLCWTQAGPALSHCLRVPNLSFVGWKAHLNRKQRQFWFFRLSSTHGGNSKLTRCLLKIVLALTFRMPVS